jgi:hypothetical protein
MSIKTSNMSTNMSSKPMQTKPNLGKKIKEIKLSGYFTWEVPIKLLESKLNEVIQAVNELQEQKPVIIKCVHTQPSLEARIEELESKLSKHCSKSGHMED